jgi:membrane dipeptidase
MRHRRLVFWLATLGPFGVGPAWAEAPVPVVDLHVDLSFQVTYHGKRPDRASGQLIASALRGSGVAGLVLPLFVPHEVSPTGPRLEDLETSYQRLLELLGHTDPYSLPGGPARPDHVRTWLAFEGAGPLAEHPEQVAAWVRRGVRIWGLVHSRDNELATSAGTGRPWPRPDHGLTPRGRELVRAIHAAGGVVDVSHASDLTVRDVLELGRAAHVPVVATHSNARQLARHPRNLTDDQIRGIAATGGLVGVNFHGPFLATGRQASLDDVVRHILHMVKLVGVDHVAIGSDFEGGIRPPAGLGDVRGYDRLARALGQAGLVRAEVTRIFSGNALRLLTRDLPVPAARGE